MGLFSIFKKKKTVDNPVKHPIGPSNMFPTIRNEKEENKDRQIAELQEKIRKLETELETNKRETHRTAKAIENRTSPSLTPSAISRIRFEGINLSSEQVDTIQKILTTGENYFVTGKAGTGKSTILRYLVENSDDKTLVCAPTGIAAVNAKGSTIHKLFGFVPGLLDVSDPKLRLIVQDTEDLLKTAKRIIIDEVSMVRADMMDAIDLKLRSARKSSLPFGGCQMICFGDLYQLPPVVAKEEEKKFLNDTYGTFFFFGAPAVRSFKIIELEQVFRQDAKGFILALNDIREANSYADTAIRYINDSAGTSAPTGKPVNIVLKNKTAEEINSRELNRLSGIERCYEAEVGGESPPQESEVMCAFHLALKTGASVMLLRNDKEQRYVNGSTGTVKSLAADTIVVEVKGKIIPLERATWSKYEYRKDEETGKLEKIEVGYARQFPVKLAYAITVHKSQGQTYDEAIIDFSGGNAFAPGQTYVALSRCKFLDHLYLAEPLKSSDVFADETVKKYMSQQAGIQ